MKARDVMTSEVAACRQGDTLNDAARLMWERDCGCVPVLDDSDRIVGIVTDRDICMATYTRGMAPGDISIESTMSREVLTCAPDDSVERIEAIMRSSRVRRVPVVDDESRIIGLVSLNDLALKAAHEKAGSSKKSGDKIHVAETLAAVCEHRLCAVPA